MKRGRFDECCPHCNKKIKTLNDVMIGADYASDFKFDCPHCSKEIQCDVHSVPEFELSKPQTVEEYKAMVEQMKRIVDEVP